MSLSQCPACGQSSHFSDGRSDFRQELCFGCWKASPIAEFGEGTLERDVFHHLAQFEASDECRTVRGIAVEMGMAEYDAAGIELTSGQGNEPRISAALERLREAGLVTYSLSGYRLNYGSKAVSDFRAGL